MRRQVGNFPVGGKLDLCPIFVRSFRDGCAHLSRTADDVSAVPRDMDGLDSTDEQKDSFGVTEDLADAK